jgi:hypothetical protein
MPRDALRFDGEVFDAAGASLGEARFWGSSEGEGEEAAWRGWLRLADLNRADLPAGRYRVRAAEGWEAEFEPMRGRPERVFDTDVLPIAGVGAAPWPDTFERPARYRPAFPDTPPRTADDRTRFPPDLGPLDTVPAEGLLPPDLEWAPVPDGTAEDFENRPPHPGRILDIG